MNTKTNNQQLKLIEHLENFRNACQNSQPSEEDLYALETILQSVPESSRYSALTTVRDEENGTILHVAMQRRYTEVVHCLVKHISQQQWNRLNSFGNKYGRTALTYSVKNRQAQKAVLGPLTSAQRFSLLTRQDNYGRTVVHQAVIENDADCVRNLSEFLSDVDWARLLCKKAKGKTAVYYAVETFKLGLLRVLRESLPPKHWSEILIEQDGEGKTLLHYAATLTPSEPMPQEMSATKSSLMEALVQSIPPDHLYNVVKVADRFGNPTLHANFECTRFLINLFSAESRCKLLGMADRKGLTLMHIAATKGDSMMMKWLLDLCSPQDSLKLIKMVDNAGNNVLHLACSEACSEARSNDVVELLMKVVPENEAFGCLKAINHSKRTPMHWAALCAFPIFALLLDMLSTSEVITLTELQDDDGFTILHLAALDKDGRNVDKLMSRLKPEKVYSLARMLDSSGATSVHYAAAVGQVHALSEIFRHLTPQQVQDLLWTFDKTKMLPIHHAVFSRSVDMVTFLLEAVSPKCERQRMLKTEDLYHLTPLGHALANNDEVVSSLLAQEFPSEKQASLKDGGAVEKTAHSGSKIQEPEDSFSMNKRSNKALEILVAEKTNENSSLQDHIAKLMDRIAELEKHLAKKTRVNEGGTENAPMEFVAEQAQLLPVKRRMSEEEKATEATFMPAPLKKPKFIKRELEDDMKVAMPFSGQVKDIEKREERSSRDIAKRDNSKGKAPKSASGERRSEKNAIPPELETRINELCRAKGVKGHILLQNPKQPTHIAILGSNTSKLSKDDIKHLTERDEKFAEYRVSVPAHQGRVYNQQLAWRNSLKVERFGLDGEGTCEMIVSAMDTQGARKVFIVGTAHMMFTRERNKLLMANVDIEELRNEVKASPSSKVYHFRSGRRNEGAVVNDENVEEDETGCQLISTLHPPLIGYLYNYRTPHDEHELAANQEDLHQPGEEGDEVDPAHCRHDMVLLPFDLSRAEQLQQQLIAYRPDRTANLLCIRDRNHLMSYNRPDRVIDIAVKGFRGRVVDNFCTVDYQLSHGIGHFLVFELDEGKLTGGDSGSILYEVEPNGDHHPLGMVTGSAPDIFNEPYYEAVILNKGFENIENSYEEITSLAPYPRP